MGILLQGDWHEFHPHLHVWKIHQLVLCQQGILSMVGRPDRRSLQCSGHGYFSGIYQMDFLVFSLPEENIFKGLMHKITTFVQL
jgi:hypothetical protein